MEDINGEDYLTSKKEILRRTRSCVHEFVCPTKKNVDIYIDHHKNSTKCFEESCLKIIWLDLCLVYVVGK